MTHKNTLPDESKIACCKICTLSEAMKDCKTCPFRIGLVFKQADQLVTLELQRENFVKNINLILSIP